MGTVARWGDKYFKISPQRVDAIYGFATAYTMKEDSNTDTSGKKKTNTRGRAPEEPTFSVKYVAAVGTRPRNDYTSWRKEVGKQNYLYIGATRYGVNKFELKSVDISEVILDSSGRTIQAVATLHFMEIIPTKKNKKKSSKKGAKDAKPSASDAKKRKKK